MEWVDYFKMVLYCLWFSKILFCKNVCFFGKGSTHAPVEPANLEVQLDGGDGEAGPGLGDP